MTGASDCAEREGDADACGETDSHTAGFRQEALST